MDIDINSDTDINLDTDTDIDVNSDTDINSDTDTDINSDTDTNPNKKQYTISKNTICFKGKFNQCLIPYYYILMKVSHVIFEENYIQLSRFNNYFPTLKNHISIIFGYSFNKPFVIPKHLTELGLGRDFNQPIVLSKNIKKLVIGIWFTSNFNQPIVLSKNLVNLRINSSFNQSLVLTKKIKIFRLEYTPFYTHTLISFPKHLHHIVLNGRFCHPIILNKTIKVLETNDPKLCICVTDSLSNIKISYPKTNNFIRDNLPNSVGEIHENYGHTLSSKSLDLNNVPNCLVEKLVPKYYMQRYVHMVRYT